MNNCDTQLNLKIIYRPAHEKIPDQVWYLIASIPDFAFFLTLLFIESGSMRTEPPIKCPSWCI